MCVFVCICAPLACLVLCPIPKLVGSQLPAKLGLEDLTPLVINASLVMHIHIYSHTHNFKKSGLGRWFSG